MLFLSLYIIQPAKVLFFFDIRKFLFVFFAYLQFFLYFCTVKAQIMAIGNVTPDSFYAASRLQDTLSVIAWAKDAIADGADILDIGACSTRPGSTPVDEEGEWERLVPALTALRTELPDIPLSLDTFRPEIARRALDSFGPMIINDISGGCEAMYALVRQWQVPYIWTLRGDLALPSKMPEVCRMEELILDPGLGFTGGVENDYACLRALEGLRAYGRPILVGLSRKSMIYKPLGLTPDTCLTATQALQLYALEHGATILRTHDVKETKQIVELCTYFLSPSDSKM